MLVKQVNDLLAKQLALKHVFNDKFVGVLYPCDDLL